MMVVICTEHAVAADSFVREEILLFGSLQRKMIPIDVGDFFRVFQEDLQTGPLIGGEAPEQETPESIAAGQPSPEVVDRILKAIAFTTQQRRLAYSVWGTLVLMGSIIVSAAGITYRIVTNAKVEVKRAQAASTAANQEATVAQGIAAAKEIAANKATDRATVAQAEQAFAEVQTGKAEYQTEMGLGRAASLMAGAPGREREAVELGLSAIAPGTRYNGAPPPEAVMGLTDATAAIWYSQPLEGSITDITSAIFSRDGLFLMGRGKWQNTTWSTVSGKRVTLSPRELDSLFHEPASEDRSHLRLDVSGDTAAVKDTSTGATKFTLSGYKGHINHYTFTQDGVFLAIGTSEGTLQVWNTTTGAPLPLFEGHSTEPYFEKFVALDRLQNPEEMQKVDGMVERYSNIGINWIAFAPHEPLMISSGNDRTARIWNLGLREPLHTLGGHEMPVRYAEFSPSGALAVSASDDGVVRLWGKDGRPLAELKAHQKPVRFVAFNSDETRIATFSFDGTARLWRPLHDDSIRTFDDIAGPLERVAFSPDGHLLAASSQVDGFTRVWSTTSGRLVKKLDEAAKKTPFDALVAKVMKEDSRVDDPFKPLRSPERAPTRFGHPELDAMGNGAKKGNSKWRFDAGPVFFLGGERLLAQQLGHDVICWNTQNWHEISRFKQHNEILSAMAVSPDGTRVVSAENFGAAFLWSASSGHLIRKLATADGLTGVVFSPSGKTFATSNYGGKAALWDARTGLLLRELDDPRLKEIGSVQFSRDGTQMLLASTQASSFSWHIVDVSNGKVTHSARGHGADWAGFSPDGSKILTINANKAILWDAASGTVIAHLDGHAFQIESGIFSPDGKFVATASWDQTLRLWDGATGHEIATLRGHLGRIFRATFSSDGRFIATASMDGTAKLYPGTLNQLVQRARNSLGYVLPHEPTSRLQASGQRREP
jgi:WD40 repeat protein